jgi:hypothetical protein
MKYHKFVKTKKPQAISQPTTAVVPANRNRLRGRKSRVVQTIPPQVSLADRARALNPCPFHHDPTSNTSNTPQQHPASSTSQQDEDSYEKDRSERELLHKTYCDIMEKRNSALLQQSGKLPDVYW